MFSFSFFSCILAGLEFSLKPEADLELLILLPQPPWFQDYS